MLKNKHIEQWYFEYNKELFNFLVYYTGNNDVEDLVQEVFIKALRSFDQYTMHSSPKTWLISIARNTAIDHHRRSILIKWVPDDILHIFHSNEKTAIEGILLSEQVSTLYSAINSLKPTYRDVILLKDLNQLSITETAEVLNWSQARVKSTYHRAMVKLKQIMVVEERGWVSG